MQIVIDIPQSLYANLKKIKNGSIASGRILGLVKDGTLLPTKHGNLIDVDKIRDEYHMRDYDFYEALRATPTIVKVTVKATEDQE